MYAILSCFLIAATANGKYDMLGPPEAAKAQPKGWLDVRDGALKKKQCVVIFVGVPSRPVKGAVVCEEKTFHQARAKAIVVAVPMGTWFAGHYLDEGATDKDIIGYMPVGSDDWLQSSTKNNMSPISAPPSPSTMRMLPQASSPMPQGQGPRRAANC